MKKSLFLALALAIICIMPSCKKSCPNDPEVSNNPITFGDNEGMVVTPYENIPLVTQYGHYSWGYVTLLYKDSNFFPMNETKYIGFKLTENDQSRLGWMKVILHHDYVELLETAIQK